MVRRWPSMHDTRVHPSTVPIKGFHKATFQKKHFTPTVISLEPQYGSAWPKSTVCCHLVCPASVFQLRLQPSSLDGSSPGVY